MSTIDYRDAKHLTAQSASDAELERRVNLWYETADRHGGFIPTHYQEHRMGSAALRELVRRGIAE
jgi:hypothetical protein